MVESFAVFDCALITLAVGERAHNLRELRDQLIRTGDPDILYHHFWSGLLRPYFVDPEYQNDFASWAYRDLHDTVLAERLSIINPGRFEDLDKLRREVVEVVEERIDEDPLAERREADHPFIFMRSQIVVLDSRKSAETPQDLASVLPSLTLGSVFYHFVDSRRRLSDGGDDFSSWLENFHEEYEGLRGDIRAIDPYFNTLAELQEELVLAFSRHLGGAGKS
ncbi:MAG: DUF5752 family protein [Desulfatibacillaceae bacterium]